MKTIRVKAYLSVEAALVMPIVTATVLLVIYFWFFQYNRCLMEIDLNTIVCKTLNADMADNNDKIEYLKKCISETYKSKYWAWTPGTYNCKIENNKIIVEQEGALEFPFSNFINLNLESNWTARDKVEADITDPVFIVRQIKKMGDKDNDN